MEHTPPPFFNTGPSALARLLIFAVLSLVLLVTDARFKYLTAVREVASALMYPLQRIAIAPAVVLRRATEFFVSNAALRQENARLVQESLTNAAMLVQFQALRAENEHLRGLLGARERLVNEVRAAEILYAARDPFARKIIVDRGSQHEVKDGQPVIDERGLVGQVTRVYPWVSEVTLITDKNHLVPVLNPRNGLRAVLAGTGNDGSLALQFVPLNSDFQTGDHLVTSGIDGVYPAGLPVAEISNVERNAAYLFARITGRPLAGVNAHTHVLLVGAPRPLAERPPEDTQQPARQRRSRRGGA
jgi:rod shape-determining protein MreC